MLHIDVVRLRWWHKEEEKYQHKFSTKGGNPTQIFGQCFYQNPRFQYWNN